MKFKFKKSVLLVLFFTISSYANSTIWLNPSDKVCKKNNGKVDKQGCKSTQSNAKKICSASGGNLASLEQLKRVSMDCGGKINTYFLGDSAKYNSSNKSYQSCYKGKGFSSETYWSSSSALNFPLSVVTSKVYDAYTICLKPDKKLEKIKKDFTRGNGMVSDNKQQLVWQDKYNNNIIKIANWDNAVLYCEELSLGKKSDWRLPNLEELETIMDKDRKPFINSIFVNIQSKQVGSTFWSSKGKNYKFYMDFNFGKPNWSVKDFELLVRCVRDNKPKK